LKISDVKLKVPSTWIQMPKIRYGNTIDSIEEKEAKWNLDNKSFLSTTGGKTPYVILSELDFEAKYITELQTNFEQQLRDRDFR
jgi:hypothetical protein